MLPAESLSGSCHNTTLRLEERLANNFEDIRACSGSSFKVNVLELVVEETHLGVEDGVSIRSELKSSVRAEEGKVF